MNYHYKKLEGEKVYLSPSSVEDADVYLAWLNDFNVTDYIGRSCIIQNYESEKAWLLKELNKDSYFMAIVRKDTDEVIGNISLNAPDFINRTAVLGIMIGDGENRSKGYGTEAINLLLDFAFNYLNLNSVSLRYIECNERARKCYEKVGFKEIGRQRACRFLNGKYYDSVYMDILASEFKGEYIKNKNVK
ncbi:MAG: GNAT family N-acetyltransferase [Clostridia bacterium]|nr:GNAT family N-acetyltransferase [Clostridia bacterium]